MTRQIERSAKQWISVTAYIWDMAHIVEKECAYVWSSNMVLWNYCLLPFAVKAANFLDDNGDA